MSRAPLDTPLARKWTETKRLKIATLLGSVLLTLCFAEVALRLFVPQQAKRLTIYDPDLGWRSEPGGKGRFLHESEGVDVRYSFNSLGFRGGEWPAVDPTAQRVVLLGDSMLEALEVDFEHTAPELVREQLGDGWQLTTVACRGWSPGQELLAFHKYGLARKPRHVVLAFFTGNDFSDNLRQPLFVLNDGELVHQPVYAGAGMALYQQAARWAYVNVHLAFHFKHGVEQAIGLMTGRGRSLPLVAVNRAEDHELVRRLLLQLDQDVHAAGAELTVAILPTSWEIERSDQSAGEMTARWLADAHIKTLPLHRKMTRAMYFRNDPHLSPQGHRFLADAVTAELQQQAAPALHLTSSAPGASAQAR